MHDRGIILSRFIAGVFFLLTSFYCLLAYIPYTYLFVVHAVPFAWLEWFVRLHPFLYWMGIAAALWTFSGSKLPTSLVTSAGIGLALIGLYVSSTRMLAHVANSWPAYLWALTFLLPVFLLGLDRRQSTATAGAKSNVGEVDECRHIPLRSAILAGCVIAVVSIAASDLRVHLQGELPAFRTADLLVRALVLLVHVFVGVVAVIVLDLLQFIATKTPLRTRARAASGAVALTVLLAAGLHAFLQNSLTLQGWMAWLYAAACASALISWSLSLLRSLLQVDCGEGIQGSVRRSVVLLLTLAFGITAPSLIGELDWNGAIGNTAALVVWIMVGATVYVSSPPARRNWGRVTAVLFTCAIALYGTRALALSRANRFETTREALQNELGIYAAHNSSFGLLHEVLGPDRSEPCDGNCRAMRLYGTVHDIDVAQDLNIAAPLKRTAGPTPNIFIIVVDSVRADYVGAYNPRVDFTPNIDAFAHDSLLLRHAYANYAGTTLSEPSIWTGVLLPHFEYPRPFRRVNNLERMASADGYQVVVSWDTVLAKLFADSDDSSGSNDIVKLDTDKQRWGQVELSSTLRQLDAELDARHDQRPILFYTQPMNVQVNAENDLPKMTDANWRRRSGFNNRIAYSLHQVDRIFGQFVADLQKRGLYDNSIIVVTADHGDATGELGRVGHSTIVYPEVMRIPLIVHLPDYMRGKYVFDENRLAALTDITPTIYYALGHRPVRHDLILGAPLIAETRSELQSYARTELFLASDTRPTFGLLTQNGRYFYTHATTPPKRMLFDLMTDPKGERNVADDSNTKEFDERVLKYLHAIAQAYRFKFIGG